MLMHREQRMKREPLQRNLYAPGRPWQTFEQMLVYDSFESSYALNDSTRSQKIRRQYITYERVKSWETSCSLLLSLSLRVTALASAACHAAWVILQHTFIQTALKTLLTSQMESTATITPYPNQYHFSLDLRPNSKIGFRLVEFSGSYLLAIKSEVPSKFPEKLKTIARIYALVPSSVNTN